MENIIQYKRKVRVAFSYNGKSSQFHILIVVKIVYVTYVSRNLCRYEEVDRVVQVPGDIIVARRAVKKERATKNMEIYGKYREDYFSKVHIWKLFRELSSNDHCHGGQNCICDFPSLRYTTSDTDPS